MSLLILSICGSVVFAAASAKAADVSGSCVVFLDGRFVPVSCSTVSSTPGNAGSDTGGASTNRDKCTVIPLSQAQAQTLGLARAPAGEAWGLLDCLGGAVGPGPQPVLVTAASGAAQVTPQQLMRRALGELQVPLLRPATAPPPGSDGLVGLPEWFWIARVAWFPRNVTVSAGAVWATVTATPGNLTFEPGAGISPVSCPGPGTAYDPRKPAADQHTDCSYTYIRPSAGLAGNVYQASLTVTWRVSWTGSGGAGGLLAAALPIRTALTIAVAQGEALVTGR
ncbi:MAG: hypothetical protein J2P29_05120 [Actinobacteria bacterium]|nr:hypothetical protein [Actinomycetota bacterium]